MSITITLDADDLRDSLFLSATARYFADLAGEPVQTIGTHTIKIRADVSEVKSAIDNLKQHATAGETGAIRDDENDQVGVDADRPNVPPVPDTADAETLPTAPEVIPDIFGKANAPSVPVVPSAPEVPAAVAPTPLASGAELDAQGLPWDARIHAATKSKVADGSWRALRGVDPALVPVVEAELRALMALPVPTPPDLPTPPVYTLAPDVKLPDLPVPDAPDAMPFPEFVQWMMATIKSGALTMAQANEAIVSVGLKGLPELTVRKDLVPAVKAAIEAML
jgi:hypothetical protein